MRTFLLIVAIHGLLLGLAFLIAGWATLLGLEAEEEAELKRDYERARQKGGFEAGRWYGRYRRNYENTISGRIS